MRILFLSAWFPYPPDNGSRIRAYNLIKALAAKHEVHLISLLQEDSRRENAAALEGICKVVSMHESRWFRAGTLKGALGYLSSRPRSYVDTYDPSVRGSVERAVAEMRPDVIVASTLGVIEYVPGRTGVPVVLEEHNCEYAVIRRNAQQASGARGMLQELTWRKFRKWESRIWRKCAAVVMVSEEDRRLTLEAAPDLTNVAVAPNGVDIVHYEPSGRNPEPGALLYNGALTYGANADAVRFFASQIYPLLAGKWPQLKLRVTGRSAGVDLSGITDCPGIQLTGYVEDIRTELNRAAACIVPLRQGGGSRLKILEAMAAGVPVVATSIGAEGTDAVPEEHILIADEPQRFAEAIERVLSNAELAARLASSARRLVEEHYSWDAIGEGFTAVVEQAAQQRLRVTI